MMCRFFVLFYNKETRITKGKPEMKKKATVKTLQITMLAVLSIMLIVLVACDGADAPPSAQSEAQSGLTDQIPEQDIGQGSTVFRFEVKDNTGTVTAWNVHTDKTTVGDALLEVGLIDGDVSEFGLFVLEVNGLVADFSANNAWWALYIDAEMAMIGVDSVEIEPGKVYLFAYTID